MGEVYKAFFPTCIAAVSTPWTIVLRVDVKDLSVFQDMPGGWVSYLHRGCVYPMAVREV